jgi:hypothetical protein
LNKYQAILKNTDYRFNNKKTWNDVEDDVTDPEEVDLKKDGSNFSESRTELDKHLSPTWKNLVLQKKKKNQFAQTRPMTFGYG